MDANVERQLTRLAGLEADMGRVRRSLSDYSGALKAAWGGRDGSALYTGAERLGARSRSIENELGRLYDAIVRAQRELEAEAAARAEAEARARAEAEARAAEAAARAAAGGKT